MSEVPQIQDLESVVNPYLNGGKLVTYKSRYLTKPGENYGSIILAVNALVEKGNGQIEELPLVVKLPPLTNDLYWQIFQPEHTCLTENAIYQYVAPAARELQLEVGIPESEFFDGFTKYYGSRISLDPKATKVDRDALLVLKNLQTSGFKPGDRHKMYDLTHTKLILRYMAQYHALPIALRKKKPKFFKENVAPYFKKFNINAGVTEEAKKDMDKQLEDDIRNITNNNEKTVDKVMKLKKLYDEHCALPEHADSIYNSLAHCDLWINNLMLRYDLDGKPNNVKIVDFQITQFDSLVHDLIFFLFSSVDVGILEENYEDLLMYYYKHFIECLQKLKVETDSYTYQSFLDEIKLVGPLEVPHALFMTKVILADKSTMPDDFKDVDFSILSKNSEFVKVVEKLGAIVRLAQTFNLL